MIEHKCLTEEEVKKARQEINEEKLKEISKKIESCVFCKRIFLKVFAE